jgi:hypothetical protein
MFFRFVAGDFGSGRIGEAGIVGGEKESGRGSQVMAATADFIEVSRHASELHKGPEPDRRLAEGFSWQSRTGKDCPLMQANSQ